MLDTLFLSLSAFAAGLLPIIGAVALVFLCILLRKAWILIEEITKTVSGLDPTLKKVDKSIDKLQSPLDTIVNYSHTLDDVQEKTKSGLNRATTSASDNINKVKTAINDKLQSVSEKIKDMKTETEKEAADATFEIVKEVIEEEGSND